MSAVEKSGAGQAGPAGSELSRRSRGRPKTGEVEAIRRDLFTAAAEQFLANGFVGTSMADIVAAAGMSKTTLYARFASKEDLFRALMAQLAEERFPPIPCLVEEHPDTPLDQVLRDFAERAFAAALTPKWKLFDRFIISEGARFPKLIRDSVGWRHEVIAMMAEYIKFCASRDGITCRDPESVARVYLMALRGFIAEANSSGRSVSAKERREVASQTVRLLMMDRADW